MALLIKHLDAVFEKDKNDMAYERYVMFEDIRINQDEEIAELVIRFDRAMKQVKAIDISYPDNVLAFKLMKSMNLSADEQKMIMTACTDIKYTSRYHLARECPRKIAPSFFTRSVQDDLECEPNLENVTEKVKLQYFNEEYSSPQTIYLADSFGNAILDTGCSKTVCGELWLKDFVKKSKTVLKTSPSSSVFGDGDPIRATKQVLLPMDLDSELFDLKCDVVSDDIPLLFNKETMQNTETVIDMVNNRVSMFGI